MIFVQVAAGVAELTEFSGQGAVILGTMHLDEEDGMLFAEQAFGSLEDRNLRTFDIAFEKVGGWVRQDILVERDGLDGNRIGIRRIYRRDMAETAVRRGVAVDASEADRRRSDHTAFSSTAACEKLL